MVEALWSVIFKSNLQIIGSGVAVFETERVFGGDGSFFYVGTYKIHNGIVTADVQITHYSGPKLAVMGIGDSFTLSVSGMIQHDAFQVSGHDVRNPGVKITIDLTRRAELPNT